VKITEKIQAKKDQQIVDDFADMSRKHYRTSRAIEQTYNTEKRPTKARRKLPGKRKWKNKEKQYAVIRGQMTMESFNGKKVRDKALSRIFKRQKKLQED
jgi:hypothetical protein